jgi:hypothetical protein
MEFTVRSPSWRIPVPVAARWGTRLALLVALTACSKAPNESAREQPAPTPVDAPLSPARRELLELAFSAASAIPMDPHAKTRSRHQADVLAAGLTLDQPLRARGWADAILDWRRGLALAEYAHWCAGHGARAEAERCLPLAAEIADAIVKAEDGQAWRRDRIRSRIAATWLVLGEPAKAAPYASDVEDSETGFVDAAKARLVTDATYAESLVALESVLATGGLDAARSALSTLIALHDRFWADEARRTQLEARIRKGPDRIKLPPGIRLELLFELAASAARHQDGAKVRELADAARGIFDEQTWLAEDCVATLATIATVRARGGDVDGARKELEIALARYDAERERIVDIWRARPLRKVAEGFVALGEKDLALATYRRAASEGHVNPNSRPRAEDLVATCLSLALSGCEPDGPSLEQLRALRAGLGQPW